MSYIDNETENDSYESSSNTNMSNASTTGGGKPIPVCTICRDAGYPNEQIDFRKLGLNPATGKPKWQLLNRDGSPHQHRAQPPGGGYRPQQQTQQQDSGAKPFYNTKKRIVNVKSKTSEEEVRNLLAVGWDLHSVLPPHPEASSMDVIYILVKRE
jgi:hypothetical protein